MIPERTGITVDSTVQGEDVAMSIDDAAIQHLMNVLTDLYADPELAVIREYSTNALDSHIEAGQTRPIEVTTPTDLRPLLTIRDYGIGLDAEDIRNIYSRYGASTKRATNDAVGMLGLGCKSALAFVDQFTLAGIKGGERTLVSVARDETGAGTMTVLEAGPTDEPDGVEVCIPASAYTDLEAKAQDFFAYWKPGLVLLNGAEPDPLPGYAVGEYIIADRVANAWNATGRHDANPLTIVMGNVSYPPPDGFSSEAVDSLPRDKRLVVTVPIGTVHFTPSREGLQDAERTRAAIHAALEDFQSEVAAAVTAAVEDAADRPGAARALIEARAAFGKANVPELKWEGEEIPTVLSAEDLAPVVEPDPKGGTRERAAKLWASKIVSGYRGGESHRAPAGQISLDDAGKNPWVLGYKNTKWTASQRRKLNRYLEHHELHDEPSKATVFITDAAAVPRPEWIDGAVTAIDWQTVREWKDPVTASEGGTGGVKYAGTYPTFVGGRLHRKYEADDLPKFGRDLYYMEGGKETSEQFEAAALLSDKAILVCLVDTRASKFKRLFPHARDARECVRRGAAGWFLSLSDDQRAAIALSETLYWRHKVIPGLPAEEIDDPELSRLIRLAELWNGTNLASEWSKRETFIQTPMPSEWGVANWEAVFDRYPIAQSLAEYEISRNLDHVLLYINAVYAANSEEDN